MSEVAQIVLAVGGAVCLVMIGLAACFWAVYQKDDDG